MAVTQPELYLGVLQTDGVIAEAWRACIYMDSLDATFNATWYFTGECLLGGGGKRDRARGLHISC